MTDYLVKPVGPEDELMRCFGILQDICAAKSGQVSRTMAKTTQVLRAAQSVSPASAASSLEPALYYVEQNFRKKLKADDVAKLCGLSSFRFSRLFKETYGIAFRDYVVRYRLREALSYAQDRAMLRLPRQALRLALMMLPISAACSSGISIFVRRI